MYLECQLNDNPLLNSGMAVEEIRLSFQIKINQSQSERNEMRPNCMKYSPCVVVHIPLSWIKYNKRVKDRLCASSCTSTIIIGAGDDEMLGFHAHSNQLY